MLNTSEWNKILNKPHHIYKYGNTKTTTDRYKVSILNEKEVIKHYKAYLTSGLENNFFNTLRRQGVKEEHLTLELIGTYENEAKALEALAELCPTIRSARMFEGQIKRGRPKKLIAQLDRDGNFIRTFNSSQEAADATGINRKVILNKCNGNASPTANDLYIWKYVD